MTLLDVLNPAMAAIWSQVTVTCPDGGVGESSRFGMRMMRAVVSLSILVGELLWGCWSQRIF